MFIKLRRSDTLENVIVKHEDISSIETNGFGSTTMIMKTGIHYPINESMYGIEKVLEKCASNK